MAEIIQRVRPEVVLINEFDYIDGPIDGNALTDAFQANYLGIGQNGAGPIAYPYVFVAPSNTGIASGFDLNNNGQIVTTPLAPGYGDDALGFGEFPGKFGMAVFSMHPIDYDAARTFQHFLWRDMPRALLPDDSAAPGPADWYSPEELAILPLSSKSHWDLPIDIGGSTVHFLVSHPTPPVFDGPEDRNGRRNFDEIRFWADYLTPGKAGYIYDDQGRTGGLKPGSSFVIAGDQNSDPLDGDSVPGAIQQLLEHPRVNAASAPSSEGAVEAASPGRRECDAPKRPTVRYRGLRRRGAGQSPRRLRAPEPQPAHRRFRGLLAGAGRRAVPADRRLPIPELRPPPRVGRRDRSRQQPRGLEPGAGRGRSTARPFVILPSRLAARRACMKYLLLLYDDAEAIAAMPPDERRALVEQHMAYSRTLRDDGAFVYGDPLSGPEEPARCGSGPTATPRRSPTGRSSRRRSPSAGSTIDCATPDAAVAVARRVPRSPGLVAELRPIPEI